MRFDRLDRMNGGWFIGDFSPSALASKDFEVAVKHYRAGDCESMHAHRIATEVTVVIDGSVRMAGRTVRSGEIVVMQPGEATAFVAITDCTTVCVKTPSVPGDKYICRVTDDR